jgi:hypothetical protein
VISASLCEIGLFGGWPYIFVIEALGFHLAFGFWHLTLARFLITSQ